MIASAQSSSAPQYLSIGKAALLLGVSVQSLREWERQGKIQSFRTCGGSSHGQRRYLASELMSQVLGVSGEAAIDEQKSVCVYVRVSSSGQAKDGNLDRQLARLLDTVAEREGIARDSIKVYRDIASAFGQRDGLNNMVDDLIEGRISRIYVEHQDRLSRVPGLTRLVEHLAKSRGVSIVALDREENVDEVKNNLLELVEFVTVLANRTNGRKGADTVRKTLTPDGLDFVRHEIASGRGLKEVVARANERGLRTEKGQQISVRTVRRYMNNEVVRKLVPLENVTHSFAEFIEKHVKARKGCKVQAAAIHSAYQLWCRSNKVVPLSARKCGDWMRAAKMRAEVRSGYTWYSEVEIVGYPSVIDAVGTWATEFDNGIRGETTTYLGRKGRGSRT
jgi:putative resolvase